MAEEWFRSSAWSEAAREDFEKRLRRARPHNRPQYLRIKGLALRDAGSVEEAMRLFRRVLDEYPDSLDSRHARELLADTLYSAGHPDEAESEYRAVLASAPNLSGTSGEVHLSLAALLLDRRDPGLVNEIGGLLEAARSHLTFNATVFRWHLLVSKLAELAGDPETQRASARRALELIGAPSQFSRHPTVGLVVPSTTTVEELRRLASA